MKMNILLAAIFLLRLFDVSAQPATGLDTAMQGLAAEKDCKKIESLLNTIIKNNSLNKDSEKLDVLYGTAAVNFAMCRNYRQFEKYIGLIRNKFNQTSFLNMAASKMLNENLDVKYAAKISERTLTLYQSFQNDSTARPKEFAKQDWERFMRFAQYPYYDTHAHALFALKKYEEALRFQEMAFPDKPEQGMPGSIERYASLLQLTGKKESAIELLMKMARLGKLSRAMEEQLQYHFAESGETRALFDSLQKNVQASLVEELKPKMLNRPAPRFTLKDLNGKTVNLSDYTGSIVVLDLWATWCKPCIASFPAMQLMVQKHPEVTFLFIAVDEKDRDRLPAVKSFIEQSKYPFTVLLDEPVAEGSWQFKITSAYKPDGIPAKYVIDKKGILRFSTGGFSTDSELINELEAMFSILDSL